MNEVMAPLNTKDLQRQFSIYELYTVGLWLFRK